MFRAPPRQIITLIENWNETNFISKISKISYYSQNFFCFTWFDSSIFSSFSSISGLRCFQKAVILAYNNLSSGKRPLARAEHHRTWKYRQLFSPPLPGYKQSSGNMEKINAEILKHSTYLLDKDFSLTHSYHYVRK